jgi:DNA-binding MarR family transcriptional regulator
MPGQSTETVPLARLFLSATGVLVDGLHEGLAARGWHEVRPAWGFVMGRLQAGPASVTDLAAFLGVSKQAASKTVEHMQAHGLVRLSPHPADGRQKMVEMTGDGERFRQDVAEIYTGLESGWAESIGRAELELMRERLTAFLTDLNGGTLPPPAPLK